MPDSPNSQTTEVIEESLIFAHLVPGNVAAKEVFSSVVDRVVHDQDYMPRTRHHLQYRAARDSVTPSVWSDSGEARERIQPRIDWEGSYVLTFENLPTNPHRGWRIGSSGRVKSKGPEDVEFIITTRRGKDGVHSHHARLNFNFDSFTLLITAEKERRVTVFANGTHTLHGSSIVIPHRATSFEIRNLRYDLIWTDMPASLYRDEIAGIKERYASGSAVPPLSIDPTPSEKDYMIPGYIVKKPFALGSTGLVSPGIRSATGEFVAIKKMSRTPKTVGHINHEIKILEELRSHGDKPFLCKLVEAVSSGSQPTKLGDVDEIYLIHTPLAFETLAVTVTSGLENDKRTGLFTQLLQSVEYIHSIGLMHRDIKPANVGIVSHYPAHAVLMDFGCAKWGVDSYDHMKGTMGYLAPEIMLLKTTDLGAPYHYHSNKPYTAKADIWALGLCGYQLFCRRQYWWPHDNSKATQIILELRESTQSKGDIFAEVTKVVEKMLQVDPEDRLSARDALGRSCFQEILHPKSHLESSKRAKMH